MSRRMDYDIAFDAPPAKIYSGFTSREYWQGLMEVCRPVTPQCEVTRFSSGGDGTDIVLTHVLPRSQLPELVHRVMPVDMVITREQHFDLYDHSRQSAEGRYTASVPHAPAHLDGRYHLTGTEAGSRLRLANVCKVHVPFIGGRVEDLILNNIKQLFDAEMAFTADWIARQP